MGNLFFIDDTITPERPEVFVMVGARSVNIQINRSKLPYVKPVDPQQWRYFRHGKELTRMEAQEFITGYIAR